MDVVKEIHHYFRTFVMLMHHISITNIDRRPQGAAQPPPKGGFDGINFVDWLTWKVLPNSVTQAVKRKWAARMRARTIGGSFKTSIGCKRRLVTKYLYISSLTNHSEMVDHSLESLWDTEGEYKMYWDIWEKKKTAIKYHMIE